MKVFIAGVMQGNRKDGLIHSQDYRKVIADILQDINSSVEVVDPDKTDPDRLSYSREQAAEMFFKYCDISSKVDLVVSYIPHASMGSAIEMWIAYNAGIPILTISPLKNNWVIKLFSTKIYSSIAKLSEDKEYIKILLDK
jgi:hypothetical protein